MNEEIKEAFSRLYFSPDEVNEELAISMKSLITKEDFIDILVDRYVRYLKNDAVMTKRYIKSVKYFAEKFKYAIENIEKYEVLLRCFDITINSKRNYPQLHNFTRIRSRKYVMTADFRPLIGVSYKTDVIRIPFPEYCNIYESIRHLKSW